MTLTPRELRQAKRRVVEASGFTTLGMHQHALQAVLEIPIEFDPFVVHTLRGDAYRELKQFHAALAEFDRAGELEPANIHVLLAKAWCYKRTDRLMQAIAVTRQALVINPRDDIIHYNLACYFCLANLRWETFFHLVKALELRPELIDSIPQERDFDSLREDPEFQILLDRFRNQVRTLVRRRLAVARQRQAQAEAKSQAAPQDNPKPKRKRKSKATPPSPATPEQPAAPESQTQSTPPPELPTQAPPEVKPKSRSRAKPKVLPDSEGSSGAPAPIEPQATPSAQPPTPKRAKSRAKPPGESSGESMGEPSRKPRGRGKSKDQTRGRSKGEATGDAAASAPE